MQNPPRPHTDAPRAKAHPEPALHEALKQSAIDGRRVEVERAKGFAKVEASAAFVFHGCASIGEYGVLLRYGSQQAMDYAAAGRVIERVPQVEALVLDGAMCVSTLAILAPVLTDDAMRFARVDGTPWTSDEVLAWAQVRTDREIRRAVRKREAEVRAGERTHARTVHLTARGVDDLERTQVLVSRKHRRAVTQGEAVEHALRDFVLRHDPLEVTPRTRRVEARPLRTDGTRNPRYVAAEVRRGLMAQHDDQCAIRHCTNRFWLENAHHTPHAAGGGNELDDQDRLCALHHRMKDHGEITRVPARAGDNHPPAHYRTREGAILRLRSPAPHDATCGGERPEDGHVEDNEANDNEDNRVTPPRPRGRADVTADGERLPATDADVVREHLPGLRVSACRSRAAPAHAVVGSRRGQSQPVAS